MPHLRAFADKRVALMKEGRQLDKIVFNRVSQGDSKDASFQSKVFCTQRTSTLQRASFGVFQQRAF